MKNSLTHFSYNGIRICTNPNLLDTKYKFVERTWKERLFSWPWDPWMHLKYISYTVPSEGIYNLPSQNTMIMHPVMARRLQEAIEARENFSP